MSLKAQEALSRNKLLVLVIVITGAILVSASIIFYYKDEPIGFYYSNGASDIPAMVTVIIAVISTMSAQRSYMRMRITNKEIEAGHQNHGKISIEIARRNFYSLQSLTCGLVLWLIAEFIWTYYQLGAGVENPFPSIADVFWLSGYPFIFYFVLRMNKIVARDGMYDREALLLVSVAAGLTLAYAFSLMFGVQDMFANAQNKVGWIISMLYPILDTVVLVPSLVLVLFLRLRKERFIISNAWMLLASSFILVTLADMAFSYTQRIGKSVEQEWFTDILYSASYILIAGALYWYNKTLNVYYDGVKATP